MICGAVAVLVSVASGARIVAMHSFSLHSKRWRRCHFRMVTRMRPARLRALRTPLWFRHGTIPGSVSRFRNTVPPCHQANSSMSRLSLSSWSHRLVSLSRVSSPWTWFRLRARGALAVFAPQGISVHAHGVRGGLGLVVRLPTLVEAVGVLGAHHVVVVAERMVGETVGLAVGASIIVPKPVLCELDQFSLEPVAQLTQHRV